jgi:CCR4-NOT transcription complex subunit 3
MERFKVAEWETKTKDYSKEGLGAAQILDPNQREKENVSCWLQSSISSFRIQTDQYESENESLIAGKKKKLDKEKQDDLKSKLKRHKFHITKLETLLRMRQCQHRADQEDSRRCGVLRFITRGRLRGERVHLRRHRWTLKR